MKNRSLAPDDARAALSSLMDGEMAAGDGDAAFAAWRHDGQARASWHAYHLIGDVLRSDDLAADPARDERFLQSLRARLAAEPVPLAPEPLPRAVAKAAEAEASPPAAAGSRRGWLVAPAAVAAGFVVVAGVLVASRLLSAEPAAEPVLAVAPARATPAGDSQDAGTLVRDARLDRYLAAHRSLANSAMAAGRGEQRVQIVFEGR